VCTAAARTPPGLAREDRPDGRPEERPGGGPLVRRDSAPGRAATGRRRDRGVDTERSRIRSGGAGAAPDAARVHLGGGRKGNLREGAEGGVARLADDLRHAVRPELGLRPAPAPHEPSDSGS
jgi:hypothetical protein